jgi:hypothetical protein
VSVPWDGDAGGDGVGGVAAAVDGDVGEASAVFVFCGLAGEGAGPVAGCGLCEPCFGPGDGGLSCWGVSFWCVDAVGADGLGGGDFVAVVDLDGVGVGVDEADESGGVVAFAHRASDAADEVHDEEDERDEHEDVDHRFASRAVVG